MYAVEPVDDMRVKVDGYVFERYGDPVATMSMSIRLAALATYYWKEELYADHDA